MAATEEARDKQESSLAVFLAVAIYIYIYMYVVPNHYSLWLSRECKGGSWSCGTPLALAYNACVSYLGFMSPLAM